MGRIISVKQHGDFKNFKGLLGYFRQRKYLSSLKEYGERGVSALANATPEDSGKTAASWSYEIEDSEGRIVIRWLNSNVVGNVNVAILIQYGHGTRNGAYVQGRDYINPAMQPIFDEMAEKIGKEVFRK